MKSANMFVDPEMLSWLLWLRDEKYHLYRSMGAEEVHYDACTTYEGENDYGVIDEDVIETLCKYGLLYQTAPTRVEYGDDENDTHLDYELTTIAHNLLDDLVSLYSAKDVYAFLHRRSVEISALPTVQCVLHLPNDPQ